MTKKITTVRMNEELSETVEIVARGRGISVNGFVVEALEAAIDRVRQDHDFMLRLRGIADRDKEVLDRLSQ
jgi:predicted DNA-binding protein